jgi:hypothetical protein
VGAAQAPLDVGSRGDWGKETTRIVTTAKHKRGIVRNLANQLAQMATGDGIMNDGPALIEEPDVGSITAMAA